MDNLERQQVIDGEQLRLLRIGYFTMGGVAVFTGLFGLFYALMGFMVVHLPMQPQQPGQPPPQVIAWFFAAFGLAFMLAAGVYALLAFLSARALRRRRARALCLVTAAVSCLYVPFGTLLGVFTFIALGRRSVIDLFNASTALAAQRAGSTTLDA
ncbi:MAG: hypothetical protein V4567_10270 [Pseudomonadota bacterium]